MRPGNLCNGTGSEVQQPGGVTSELGPEVETRHATALELELKTSSVPKYHGADVSDKYYGIQ